MPTIVAFLAWTIWEASAYCQTNGLDSNGVPILAPPHPELQPTFWERDGMTILAASIAVALLIGLTLWLILRTRPANVIPPEIEARRALEKLLQSPEDGALLIQVSSALRRYFIAAFELPPGEPSTTELCDRLNASEQVGPELATSLGEFLRQCDERKFAPTPNAEPLNAARHALELVARGESRRAQLRQRAATQAPGQALPKS